jgi:hypothetical protein
MEKVMKIRIGFGWTLIGLFLFLMTRLGLASRPQIALPSDTAGVDVSPSTKAPWYVETVDSAEGVGSHVSIAIDAYGTTYISYYDATNKDLKMAKSVGSGGNCGTDSKWFCEIVDNIDNDVGLYTSIAIDPTTNLPVIAYWSNLPDYLKLATAKSGSWDIVTIDDGSGKYASLKIDSSGAPHIAYHRYGVLDKLNYASYVGGGGGNCGGNDYQCDTLDSGSGVGQYPSLALDGAGQPRIAYYDRENGRVLYAHKNNGNWTIDEILQTAWDQYLSLAIDINNGDIPHIAHYDGTNDQLGYAVYIEDKGNCGYNSDSIKFEWQCDDVDAMGPDSHTMDVSLAVDNTGMPIIAYHKYLIGDPLSIVTFNVARPSDAMGMLSGNCGQDDQWWCERLPESGHSGDYSAIAVNPSGLATIAYYNSEFFGVLKVVYQRFQILMPLMLKIQ